MRISSILFLCFVFCNSAKAQECGTAVVGPETEPAETTPSKIKSWNLGGGFSFERNDELYYIKTPNGPVNLPAGHYANFHNISAIARQPDAIEGHPGGFFIIAVNDGHLSHLLALDAMTGQKYRHRNLHGVVTEITSLPDSMLILTINSPNDSWEPYQGNRLELVDTNIHGPHDFILVPADMKKPTEEILGGIRSSKGIYHFAR